MKKFKKLASLFLAALMMLTMALPVMATSADSNTVKKVVKNLPYLLKILSRDTHTRHIRFLKVICI